MTTTTEQVIVGKMSLPQVQGQISLFTLPQNFVWLKHFTAEEIAEFFAELFEALSQSAESDDWSAVAAVIESWKATANIEADPAIATAVEQGLAELAEGQSVGWADLQKDLGL